MVLCCKCSTPMEPSHTGIVVRWRGHWCKRGDRYTCLSCSNSVIVVSSTTDGYNDRTDPELSKEIFFEAKDKD